MRGADAPLEQGWEKSDQQCLLFYLLVAPVDNAVDKHSS